MEYEEYNPEEQQIQPSLDEGLVFDSNLLDQDTELDPSQATQAIQDNINEELAQFLEDENYQDALNQEIQKHQNPEKPPNRIDAIVEQLRTASSDEILNRLSTASGSELGELLQALLKSEYGMAAEAMTIALRNDPERATSIIVRITAHEAYKPELLDAIDVRLVYNLVNEFRQSEGELYKELAAQLSGFVGAHPELLRKFERRRIIDAIYKNALIIWEEYRHSMQQLKIQESGLLANIGRTKILLNDALTPEEEQHVTNGDKKQTPSWFMRRLNDLGRVNAARRASIEEETKTLGSVRIVSAEMRNDWNDFGTQMRLDADDPAGIYQPLMSENEGSQSVFRENLIEWTGDKIEEIEEKRRRVTKPDYDRVQEKIEEAKRTIDKMEEGVKFIEDSYVKLARAAGSAKGGKLGGILAGLVARCGIGGGHQLGYLLFDGKTNSRQLQIDIEDAIAETAEELISLVTAGAVKKIKLSDIAKMTNKLPKSVQKKLHRILKKSFIRKFGRAALEEGKDALVDTVSTSGADAVRNLIQVLSKS